MSFDITIHINEVETDDPEQLEILCDMMASVCETMCRNCCYETVKRFGLAEFDLQEVKDE